MPNGRATTANNAEAVNTAYALSLLSEYGYTLDSLPLELSRTFADLRELDAVLSTSMVSITAKIQRLTAMIEQGNGPGAGRREERLYLLAEIAEEAQRLKPGGEDKIRVACQAADALKANALHLSALMDHVPGQEYDVAVMSRNTTYPHVATRNWAVPHAYESRGRRRPPATGQLILHGATDAPSPKKRRTVRDEEDPSYGRSPRKDKGDKQQRNAARAKKIERVPSPAESMVSITSHLPPSRITQNNGRSGSTGTVKRARDTNGADGHSRGGSGHPPASSHPSLPVPASGRTTQNSGNDWSHGQLEGPGVPPAHGSSQHPPLSVSATNALGLNGTGDDIDAEPDGADDQDETLYCFCNRVSFGEMVACDDDQCEREWFHLGCTGMAVAPEGKWYCADCQTRRDAKRGNRSGKRKAGGGRKEK